MFHFTRWKRPMMAAALPVLALSLALTLLGLGFLKAIYDVVDHPVKIATDTVLVFVNAATGVAVNTRRRYRFPP